MNFKKIYINGEWIDASKKEFISIKHPINKEIIVKVPRCNLVDVDLAKKYANEVLKISEVNLEERKIFVKKFIIEARKHKELMINSMIQETGGSYEASRIKVNELIGNIATPIEEGNCIILKPTMGVILVSYILADIVNRLECDKGVFGLITGIDEEIGVTEIVYSI